MLRSSCALAFSREVVAFGLAFSREVAAFRLANSRKGAAFRLANSREVAAFGLANSREVVAFGARQSGCEGKAGRRGVLLWRLRGQAALSGPGVQLLWNEISRCCQLRLHALRPQEAVPSSQ